MPKKSKGQRRAAAHAARQEKAAERARKRELARQRRKANAGAWKSDMRKFRDQLSRYGLRIKEMDPDGNCMFRAIADQLWGAPERHGEVRADVINFMRDHEEDFAFWIVDDESFEEYLRRMSKNREWGGHLELHALSTQLNVNVCVHQLEQPRWEMNVAPGARTLHLSYHDGEHYNSVRNIDDNGFDAPTKIVIRAPGAVQPAAGSDGEATAEEKLVMQSTGKPLDAVRECMAMLGGDVDYTIEYLIAATNAEAEAAASQPAGASEGAGGSDGAGAGAGAGAPDGSGGNVPAAVNDGLSPDQALAAALAQSLAESEAKKGASKQSKEESKKAAKKKPPEPKKGDKCPCGSKKKYGKCCRKRLRAEAKRAKLAAAQGNLTNKQRKALAKQQKRGAGAGEGSAADSDEDFVDDLGALQI